MSNEYQIGKEISKLEQELEVTRTLVQQLYAVVEHNIKTKKITDVPKGNN